MAESPWLFGGKASESAPERTGRSSCRSAGAGASVESLAIVAGAGATATGTAADGVTRARCSRAGAKPEDAGCVIVTGLGDRSRRRRRGRGGRLGRDRHRLVGCGGHRRGAARRGERHHPVGTQRQHDDRARHVERPAATARFGDRLEDRGLGRRDLRVHDRGELQDRRSHHRRQRRRGRFLRERSHRLLGDRHRDHRLDPHRRGPDRRGLRRTRLVLDHGEIEQPPVHPGGRYGPLNAAENGTGELGGAAGSAGG